MDYWDIYPYLPRETRGYVPAFVGVMYAMTYHQEYGIEPQDVGMPAATDTFEIRKNLHFRQISDVVGVPIEEIETLNPQYFNNIIPGDNHSYILRLPSSWTGAFLAAEPDSLYGYKRDSLLSSRVIRDVQNSGRKASQDRIAYRVRSGDYLGKIAGRYGVSVSQLKRWNNLRSSNIRAGQTLYIYGASPKAAAAAASQQSSSSGSGRTYTIGSYYTVKSGDSLYNIAKLYPGVSAENIKEANGLKSDRIRPGQELKIPLP